MKCTDCEFFGAEQEWTYCYLNGYHMDSIGLIRKLIEEGDRNRLKVITPRRKRVPPESRASQPAWCPLNE